MMRHCFIPRGWRFPSAVWGLLILEFPFTVANLALFGIASPNLYRTILWTEGGKLGLNSDPTTVLYAAANYRPVTIPLVWSSFNTQYNLVIGVLCMFFWLTKITGWFLHALWPIFSLPLHAALLSLWSYSVYMQTAPDRIDPDRINNGAPWYITKNCDIASSTTIKQYCMQAKSSFAVSVIMLVIYAVHVILALYSLLCPSAESRTAHEAKRAKKLADREKWAHLDASPLDNNMTAEQQWQHMWELQQLPRTPGAAGGFKDSMAPRTQAFGQLDGSHSSPHAGQGWYDTREDGRGDVGRASPEVQHEWYASGQGQLGQGQPDAHGLGVHHGGEFTGHEVDEYVPQAQGKANA